MAVVAGVVALGWVSGALGASSRIATPIPCGLIKGAPWTLVVKAPEAVRRGTRYYVYETSNLSCADVARRVAPFSRMTPDALRRVSFPVSTGERLHCVAAAPPKEIKSVHPRTAWGWCGTDVGARVARLGVTAAAGTEFFWVTADKNRGF